MKHASQKLQSCDVCGSMTATLRRGRCWMCYLRWADRRPVGLGASCVICMDRRRENLRMVEFQNAWIPMCHNCASKIHRLTPIPSTIEGIRQRLHRDRRWNERRDGQRDHRIFATERRANERRNNGRENEFEWIDAEELIIEITDLDPTPAEATRIAATAASDGAAE